MATKLSTEVFVQHWCSLLSSYARLLSIVPFKQYGPKTECFKVELKKIDPNSDILKDFDEAKMETSADECVEVIDNKGYEEMIETLESAVGNFEEFTCGLMPSIDIKKFGISLASFDLRPDNEAKKQAALKKFNENLLKNFQKLFECFSGKV